MEQKGKSKKIERTRVKQKSRTKHQKYSNADKNPVEMLPFTNFNFKFSNLNFNKFETRSVC